MYAKYRTVVADLLSHRPVLRLGQIELPLSRSWMSDGQPCCLCANNINHKPIKHGESRAQIYAKPRARILTFLVGDAISILAPFCRRIPGSGGGLHSVVNDRRRDFHDCLVLCINPDY